MPDLSALRLPTVHACPPDGSGLMPCCGRTPFEVLNTDRLARPGGFVTCGYTQTARLEGRNVVITLTPGSSDV